MSVFISNICENSVRRVVPINIQEVMGLCFIEPPLEYIVILPKIINCILRRLKMFELKSDILEVVKVNKKTNAELFKGLKVGDKIQLIVDTSKVGRVGNTTKTKAKHITIVNVCTNETRTITFNRIDKMLSCFEFSK